MEMQGSCRMCSFWGQQLAKLRLHPASLAFRQLKLPACWLLSQYKGRDGNKQPAPKLPLWQTEKVMAGKRGDRREAGHSSMKLTSSCENRKRSWIFDYFFQYKTQVPVNKADS